MKMTLSGRWPAKLFGVCSTTAVHVESTAGGGAVVAIDGEKSELTAPALMALNGILHRLTEQERWSWFWQKDPERARRVTRLSSFRESLDAFRAGWSGAEQNGGKQG